MAPLPAPKADDGAPACPPCLELVLPLQATCCVATTSLAVSLPSERACASEVYFWDVLAKCGLPDDRASEKIVSELVCRRLTWRQSRALGRWCRVRIYKAVDADVSCTQQLLDRLHGCALQLIPAMQALAERLKSGGLEQSSDDGSAAECEALSAFDSDAALA